MEKEKEIQNPGYNVFFTSDLHFRHKSIIKHCPSRIEVMGLDGLGEDEMLTKHDQWLIDAWNAQVSKKDHVYILGDLSFANVPWTQRIMGKLKGKKFLILGNHDQTCKRDEMQNYFVTVSQIKEQCFKKSQWGFLDEDLMVTMCHYPMVTWNCKHWGAVQLHGHAHGRLDTFNASQPDLRLDIGIDSQFAQYKLVSLKEVYTYFKNKTRGEMFRKYAIEKKEGFGMTI